MYRFVIGREKPGQVSEVAQLISQTLEQERRQRELLEQHYAQYDADDDEVTDCPVSRYLCFLMFCFLFLIPSFNLLLEVNFWTFPLALLMIVTDFDGES